MIRFRPFRICCFSRLLPAVAAAAACFGMLPSCALLVDRDLSRQAPYSNAAGRTVTLQRPMEILPGNETMNRHAPNDLVTPGRAHDPGAPSPLTTLPRHERITIESVRRVNYFDWIAISAVGATIPKHGGEPVRFEYCWGSEAGGKVALQRAPWEDASIPERRWVGLGGRSWFLDRRSRQARPAAHPPPG